MTIKTAQLVSLAVAAAVIAPTAAVATVKDPQSDAAMRKAIRGYAKAKTMKATHMAVDCVQADEISSTRPCSGTFRLTRGGKTAHYRLTSKSDTFRNSPGTIVSNLNAVATKKAPGMPTTVKWGAILH